MSAADISIITVVLNDLDGLRHTIDSIQKQQDIRIEHIIVDGGSSDGSQLLAIEHSDVQIASQSDGGIYQGMQRGAESATSKYLMFVNSADQLEGTTSLANAIQILERESCLWGFGPILENTLRSTTKLSGGVGKIELNAITSRKTFVPFPVVVMRRDEFFRVGGLKYSYRIAGDFDLIVRLSQSTLPIRWHFPLVRFAAGGISYTMPVTAWREEHLIRVKNLRLGTIKSIISNLIFLRRVLRWKIGKLLDVLQSLGILGRKNWRDRG
jgi:glycosyltransferase involved in cell wall biosynthesis